MAKYTNRFADHRFIRYTEEGTEGLRQLLNQLLRSNREFTAYGLDARNIIAATEIYLYKTWYVKAKIGKCPYTVHYEPNHNTLTFFLPPIKLLLFNQLNFNNFADLFFREYGILVATKHIAPWPNHINVSLIKPNVWRVQPSTLSDSDLPYRHYFIKGIYPQRSKPDTRICWSYEEAKAQAQAYADRLAEVFSCYTVIWE